MTWRTNIGERVIEGHEALLRREAIATMKELFDEELEEDVDPWSFGVPLFDSLEPLVKLALLAEVGWALLRPTKECPALSAVNESVIGAIFSHIEQSIEFEIDCHDDAEIDPSSWRQLTLNVLKEIGEDEDLHSANCLDSEEWDISLEVLRERILWDEDFNDADIYMDLPAEHGKAVKEFMTIDQDYFRAVPPNPRESDLPTIQRLLTDLIDG
ncbi:MAG: hypothetical protein JWN70_4525 [Planctomycetaceae bacterium]|nr:hypothetical protein [Planctomycetaceae bacterium]